MPRSARLTWSSPPSMKLPSAASGHFPLLFVLTEFIFASGSAQSHSKNIPIAEQTNHELPVPVFLSPYIFLNRLLTGSFSLSYSYYSSPWNARLLERELLLYCVLDCENTFMLVSLKRWIWFPCHFYAVQWLNILFLLWTLLLVFSILCPISVQCHAHTM